MHYRAITELAIDEGLIDPRGLTPEASMNAAITQDIKRKSSSGRQQRFRSHGRGLYGLAVPRDPLGGALTANNQRVREQLRAVLADTDPRQFEWLIGALLVGLGFEDVEVTRYSGDGGIDVRAVLSVGGITEVKTAIQVKRWSNNVSGRVVRELRGGLGPHDRGLIITLSRFTKDAVREAVEIDRSPISLIDGERLVDLLVEYEIGVTRKVAEILQLDEESLSPELPEEPADVDPPGLSRRPSIRSVSKTAKSLSVWPLPGGAQKWKSTLDSMLMFVAGEAPTVRDATSWLIDSFDRVRSEKVARGYWHLLRSFGLTESDGEQLILTGDGASYLEEPTPERLLKQIRERVAGIDEIIDLLAGGPADFSTLRNHLNTRLGTEWETDAQVRFRLGWLAVLGVVEIDGANAALVSTRDVF
jgi:hypothetical protein